jgi:TolB protein
MKRRTLILGLLWGAASAPLLLAQDEVVLKGQKGAARVRIHCESLAPEGDRNARESSVQADEVLANDLDYSAVFQPSRSWSSSNPPGEPQAIVSGKWRVNGSQIRLTGEVRDLARRPILSKEFRGSIREWRRLVHQFADEIVRHFTGEPGIAQTQIAFAAQIGRDKELFVMDYDGAGLRQITRDRSIALSPAWSPEGSLLLFTSYRSATGPQVYVQSLSSGKPFLISGRKGLNTSASYSPDGREIVCSLSMDGNAELYRLDARGGSPRRLTSNRAIDTSPCWSPTGQEIAFTSDRGGSPQVYVMDREGGNVRRLTYDVDYTDSPAWSPKGDRIAFVSRTGQGFDIYVCRSDGRGALLVAGGRSNENPRWSPDGRHLVFASNRDGAYRLYVTDLDNRPPRKLETGGHPALSPAWSPRLVNTRSAFNLDRSH